MSRVVVHDRAVVECQSQRAPIRMALAGELAFVSTDFGRLLDKRQVLGRDRSRVVLEAIAACHEKAAQWREWRKTMRTPTP